MIPHNDAKGALSPQGKFDKFAWQKSMHGRGLTTTEYTIAIILGDFADGATGGSSRPGVARLADAAGISERTVERALRSLKSQGWIVETRRGGTGRAKSATTYRLATPPDDRTSREGVAAEIPGREAFGTSDVQSSRRPTLVTESGRHPCREPADTHAALSDHSPDHGDQITQEDQINSGSAGPNVGSNTSKDGGSRGIGSDAELQLRMTGERTDRALELAPYFTMPRANRNLIVRVNATYGTEIDTVACAKAFKAWAKGRTSTAWGARQRAWIIALAEELHPGSGDDLDPDDKRHDWADLYDVLDSYLAADSRQTRKKVGAAVVDDWQLPEF